MDDDEQDSGFGGLAWYQIGRWSERSARETDETVDHLLGRAPVARADYNHAVQMNQALAADNQQVHAQNQQLRAQIAALHQSVQGWERDYEKLGAIANKRSEHCSTLMDFRDRLLDQMEDLEDELQELRRKSREK